MSLPLSSPSKQPKKTQNRALSTGSQSAASVPAAAASSQKDDGGDFGDPLKTTSSHHQHAQSRSARRKRSRKRSTILIFFLFLLIVFFAVQVYFHRDWLEPLSTMPEMLLESHPEWKLDSSSSAKQDQKSNSTTRQDNPLLRMFFEAGVKIETELTTEERAKLPTVWHNLKEMYGNSSEPIIWGLQTCQAYRDKVPDKRQRYTAVAGLFNTGTNAMEFHLQHNLKMPSKWQVPWGKHRVPAVRLNHTAAGMDKLNREHVMPIIMIRDPFAFMQSMCKSPYATVCTCGNCCHRTREITVSGSHFLHLLPAEVYGA